MAARNVCETGGSELLPKNPDPGVKDGLMHATVCIGLAQFVVVWFAVALSASQPIESLVLRAGPVYGHISQLGFICLQDILPVAL